jgi:glycosyltransferase involved in cell wall biosynthesis
MARHHRRGKAPRRSRHVLAAVNTSELPESYCRACRLATNGQHDEARRLYTELNTASSDVRLRALIDNDLATLDAVSGNFATARQGLEAALAIDESCRPARLNLELIANRLALFRGVTSDAEAGMARVEPRPPEMPALSAVFATSPSARPQVSPAWTAPCPPETAEPDATLALGAGLMTPPSARPQVSPAWTEAYHPAIPESHIESAEVGKASAGFLTLVRGGVDEPADAGIGVMNVIGSPQAEPSSPTRVAVLSFLFNWPSTGGSNIHTVELATFLGRAGYEVCHIYVRFPQWGIGQVGDVLPFESQAMEFERSSWELKEIQARYRRAVRSFDPDYVIITDAWNMKPILAEAVEGYPYYLRFQALECLCPLNNLRLLARGPQTIEQCPKNQLANPEVCCRCLFERGHHSGSLHQWERELCQVGTPEHDRQLRRALEEAEAVLVLNPLIAALVEPYARNVRVVPWGMDPSRFPWPLDDGVGAERPVVRLGGGVVRPAPSAKLEGGVVRPAPSARLEGGVVRPAPSAARPVPSAEPMATLFMAAVQGEFIKGYHIAHEACRLLRQTRSDFELVVTFDPPGQIDEFTRSVGWCSQAELPRHYHAADICLVPTIAQEG